MAIRSLIRTKKLAGEMTFNRRHCPNGTSLYYRLSEMPYEFLFTVIYIYI